MESSSGSQLLQSLNTVVDFLHTEGFYAAEETLLREIENRYPAPDAGPSRHVSASPGSSGSARLSPSGGAHQAFDSFTAAAAGAEAGTGSGLHEVQQAAETVDLQPVDFQPALAAAAAQAPLLPVDSMESAEKVLEAWRSKSTTPAASPKKAALLSLPASPGSGPKAWGGSPPDGASEAGVDEYDDDDDPGYMRLDVVGQEATLGLELDQQSEASGAREAAYYQLRDFDSPQEQHDAHARHASIDIGLLNRQLHGAHSTPSSQRSHAKQQPPPVQQQQPQQQAVLMHEPVTSTQHWRSGSDAQLLPPGLSGPTSGTVPQQQAHQEPSREPGPASAPVGEASGEAPQQPDSPNASSHHGDSSCFSGELAGSPAKREPGHKRSSSYAQRQAGTAQWVFDRANSADTDAYRSLLHHLDRPGTGKQTQSPTSTTEERQQQAPRAPPPAGAPERKQPPVPKAAPQPAGCTQAEADAGSPLFHQESISRVSSLGESMLQEAAALNLCDAHHELQEAQAQQQQQEIEPLLSAAGQVDSLGLDLQPCTQRQLLAVHQQQQQHDRQQAGAGPTPDLTSAQPPTLPSLRMTGGHTGSGLQHFQSAPTQGPAAAQPDSEVGRSAPHDGSGRTPDGDSIVDYADPFSFPITPPSEVAPAPDPAPLFGSWASFKSSPDRKSGALGGYGTEDESTPARRRYQQQAAVAAAAAAAAAKASGEEFSRSIKFPPLGAGVHAAAGGMPQGYGSSNQLLSYATPPRALSAEEELGDGSEFDQEYFDSKYEVLNLKVIHRRHCTGFEQARELPLHIDDLIAGRYKIVDLLGQAAFSRAVQALDLKTGALVCLKIIKNNKDYFDQGLDEVKLLQYVNAADPMDEAGILRLHDFFYFKEHLVLVTELLRANLYEFQKYNRESGEEPYFTLPRIQSIARQVLTSLAFLHSLGLVHADLKPENILVKSYSRCQVKVIDLGSSCFLTDHLSSYVQSRSYRAPEVILGLPYSEKVDVWSLGCILAELATGRVLFQNDSIATLLARLEGILGPVPRWMLHRGRYAHKYYLRDGRIFEKSQHTGRYEFLRPKNTSLARRVPPADDGMLAFLEHLLQVDPTKRPSAAEALQHHWLQSYY